MLLSVIGLLLLLLAKPTLSSWGDSSSYHQVFQPCSAIIALFPISIFHRVACATVESQWEVIASTHACGTPWPSWLNATTRFSNENLSSAYYILKQPLPGAAVLWQVAIPPISWPQRACLLLGLSLPIHLLHPCSQTACLPPPTLRPTQACLAAPHVHSCSCIPLLLPLPWEGEPGHGVVGQLLLNPPAHHLHRHPCSPLTCRQAE